MPQWAGSCWYYLRYIDPKNDTALLDPAKEHTGCRSISMSAAPSMPCCTCSTAGSGTKCFSIAGLSPPEPFRKLVNQGMILGEDGVHGRRGCGRAMDARPMKTARNTTSRGEVEDQVVKKGEAFVTDG